MKIILNHKLLLIVVWVVAEQIVDLGEVMVQILLLKKISLMMEILLLMVEGMVALIMAVVVGMGGMGGLI